MRSLAGSDLQHVTESFNHRILLKRKISGFVSASNYEGQTDEALLSTLHLMREETARHVREFQAQNGSFVGVASSMQALTPFDKLAGSSLYGAVDLSSQAKVGAQAKRGQRNLTGSRSDQGYEFQQAFRSK